ncbi:protein TILLER ANGLE CONTROL 1 [Rhodamnia argentea]|uniref:Protein TILLER ANGLE CONTROL 1 n=1 Tax=Rhodamnia argentea TaxID=178133 RepID=A0A8B8QLV7_9MYRT|nr:protein TILLER ANGLE CONTROL 1 [Rhodamnia argentea]
MKIFNWVQKRKRLNPNVLQDHELGRSVKNPESITADALALLEGLTFAGVLDGWKDGILTIGTFGYDPLKPLDQEKDELFLESHHESQEEEEYQHDLHHYPGDREEPNVEDEEQNPLMLTTFCNNDLVLDDELRLLNQYTDEIAKPRRSMVVDNVELAKGVVFEEEKKKKGQRVTLADLFSADSDVKGKPYPSEVDQPTKPLAKKDPASTKKDGQSFAKKLIHHMVSEDSRPTRKLHRLMRKMLKKKIHPELGSKINDKDDQMMKPGCIHQLLVTNNNQQKDEYHSLLQSPQGLPAVFADAMV